MAADQFPIYVDDISDKKKWTRAARNEAQIFGYPLVDLRHFGGYLLFSFVLNSSLLGAMVWMFNSRWRVSTSTG